MRDGWIAVEDSRIVDCGGPRAAPPAGEARGFAAAVAILPGLVNAHTHLELSWMRDRVPPAGRFDVWVRGLVRLRRESQDAGTAAAIDEAIAEARASGTALFGDISNSLATVPCFRTSGAFAHVFHELLGFNAPGPGDRVRQARAVLDALADTGGHVRASLSPHAPYSVSPGLFRAIRQDLDEHSQAVASVHLGESADEVEFLRTGGGAIRQALEELGAWNPDWRAPGVGPVEYLDRFGLVNDRLLAVHGVQLVDAELERLAAVGATVITCPRSNRWTGAGTPPISRFYAAGVRVAIGTDSLASVDDLNLFHELAAVRTIASGVPARSILESATKCGAEALGFADELGTIEPGKRAELLAVRIPDGLTDVEEYLLSGIAPADIRWLDRDVILDERSAGRRA
jgi:cytosine/adenosine deaminase-related metal-dependent hydrolase